MNKVLLDTQAFIFALNSPKIMPLRTRRMFDDPELELYLSVASIWEMSLKATLGKLKLDKTIKDMFELATKASAIKLLPIETGHIYKTEELKFHHKDPFDRLIVAQSIAENMPVISSDKVFDKYKVERIWK